MRERKRKRKRRRCFLLYQQLLAALTILEHWVLHYYSIRGLSALGSSHPDRGQHWVLHYPRLFRHSVILVLARVPLPVALFNDIVS